MKNLLLLLFLLLACNCGPNVVDDYHPYRIPVFGQVTTNMPKINSDDNDQGFFMVLTDKQPSRPPNDLLVRYQNPFTCEFEEAPNFVEVEFTNHSLNDPCINQAYFMLEKGSFISVYGTLGWIPYGESHYEINPVHDINIFSDSTFTDKIFSTADCQQLLLP